MLEEVPDLLERDLRQVGIVGDILVAPGEMRRRHGDDLLVHAGVVFHQKHADRPHVDDASGNQCARVADQHVDGVAVARQRVGNEAVVAGITHRRIEEAVDDQRARVLVHLVFDRLAADRNLDDDVDVFGGIVAGGYRFQAHGGVSSIVADPIAAGVPAGNAAIRSRSMSDRKQMRQTPPPGRHSQTKATFFSAFCSKISTPSAMSRPPAPA